MASSGDPIGLDLRRPFLAELDTGVPHEKEYEARHATPRLLGTHSPLARARGGSPLSNQQSLEACDPGRSTSRATAFQESSLYSYQAGGGLVSLHRAGRLQDPRMILSLAALQVSLNAAIYLRFDARSVLLLLP